MTPHRRHRGALLAGVALWGAGLATGVVGVARLVPEPVAPELRAKLEHLEANPDKYDTLFFGSSRIYRGLDPRVFDRVMAARGHPTTSFNLAFSGMRAHETNALLRRVLSRPPDHLRFVIVELSDWQPRIVARDTARAVAWHDSYETLSALRSTALAEVDWRGKLDLARGHLEHWARQSLRIGAAAEWVGDCISRDRMAEDEGVARRGHRPFAPAEYRLGRSARNRRKFLADLTTYDTWVAAMIGRKPKPLPATYNLRALESQRDRILRAGATPVYLIAPYPAATAHLDGLAVSGTLPVLLAFDDPGRDPELFLERHRFDFEHLNAQGARIFSRRVAAEFAAFLESN